MKRRLRKKIHKGEFTVYGRALFVKRNTKEGFEKFFDWLIEEVVEGNDCFCAGFGQKDFADLVIELGRKDQALLVKTEAIISMLQGRADVKEVLMSDLMDMWNGDREQQELRSVWKKEN